MSASKGSYFAVAAGASSPAAILGANYVTGWIDDGVVPTGAYPATDYFQTLSVWEPVPTPPPPAANAYDLVPFVNAPDAQQRYCGPQDRAGVAFNRSAPAPDAAINTHANIATIPNNLAAGFTLLLIDRIDSITPNRFDLSWGTTGGGAQSVGIWTRTVAAENRLAMRIVTDGGASTHNWELATNPIRDNRFHYMIFSWAGNGNDFRVWYDGAEQVGLVGLTIPNPLTCDVFCPAARYTGAGPNNQLTLGVIGEMHVARGGVTDAQADKLNQYMLSRWRSQVIQATDNTHTNIISPSSPGWPTPNNPGTNIMFPSTIVEAGPVYNRWVGGHNDEGIALGTSATRTGANTIVGTDYDLTALVAGSGGNFGPIAGTDHLSSPCVFPGRGSVAGLYVCTAHALVAGFGHNTCIATSPDKVTWTILYNRAFGGFGVFNAAINEFTEGIYLRVWLNPFDDVYYAVGSECALWQSQHPDGLDEYIRSPNSDVFSAITLPVNTGGVRARHCGVLVIGDFLFIAFTMPRSGTPVPTGNQNFTERIFFSVARIANNGVPIPWTDWVMQAVWPRQIWVETTEDGNLLPWMPSVGGIATTAARQLRDPNIWRDPNDGRYYCDYAVQGEQGISTLDINDLALAIIASAN